MPDGAVTVDDVGDPARYQTEHGRYSVRLADLAAFVGEQRERQVVLAREPGMPVRRVGTDADHLGARVGEHLVAIAERARLCGAAARVVLGIEVQNYDARAEPVIQPDRFTGLG